MNIEHLTEGQAKFLLESLERQKSKKTQAETILLNDLRERFSEVIEQGSAKGFKRCGDYVKMINMDTFGDNYKNNWIKVKQNTKGEYFIMKYLGNKRIYID